MLVTMSDKEPRRINVIQSVVEKRMRRRDAVQQLALTERQTQRLMNRFRESGAAGLTNLRRGRPGNHRLPESLKLRVLSLLHDHYSDFGPTLAAENLDDEKSNHKRVATNVGTFDCSLLITIGMTLLLPKSLIICEVIIIFS